MAADLNQLQKTSHYLVEVFYEDTDLSGCVYHANYLKYFDRARTVSLGEGFLNKLMTERGLHFVVVRAEIDYKFPARLGDKLNIDTTLSGIKGARATYTQKISANDRLIATATIILACLDREFRPAILPAEVMT